ncbi:hypothetical protein [Aliidongia dinghuensis]|nr:hypothetical protein [Aliidongia dinghuensis]
MLAIELRVIGRGMGIKSAELQVLRDCIDGTAFDWLKLTNVVVSLAPEIATEKSQRAEARLLSDLEDAPWQQRIRHSEGTPLPQHLPPVLVGRGEFREVLVLEEPTAQFHVVQGAGSPHRVEALCYSFALRPAPFPPRYHVIREREAE